jgi:hypothetical protein
MIELLLPCVFDTLEYSCVKAIIVICTLVDYSVAKKRQYDLDSIEPAKDRRHHGGFRAPQRVRSKR